MTAQSITRSGCLIACLWMIGGHAWGQPVLPNFAAAVFDNSLNINHSLFPLVPGTVFTYEKDAIDPVTGEPFMEEIVVEVLADTRAVAGVSARVVRDRVWDEDGLILEDTYDWFAQDNVGNVWYMGEFATSYEYDDDGNLIGTNHDGSWEAGVSGASPGYIMQASPMIGDFFFQEFAPGIAEDAAEVLALNETHTVPTGTYQNVLRTLETTSLDPDSFDHKFYALGVGRILEHGLEPTTGAILSTTRLVSIVPEPSAPFALLALTLLLWRG